MKYTLNLDGDLRQKAEQDMKSLSFKTLSGFMRFMLNQFGKTRWTDEDMMDFARAYSRRSANPPAVLESEERQIKIALTKFKSSK